MRSLTGIYWLGTKELWTLLGSIPMMAFLIYSFTFSVYQQSEGVPEDVNRASVTFVDEDQSTLSRKMRDALYPPFFKVPEQITAAEIEDSMDAGRFMFVVVVPPDFESDVREGRSPEIQINIDATAVRQAALGASYIQSIVTKETRRFVSRTDATEEQPITLIQRKAFNPNGTNRWNRAVTGVLDQLSMLTIILTGAAILREREHGTLEHLLTLPLTSFQIAISKVWANGLVILACFMLSMVVVVEGMLNVPFAGSRLLLFIGTVVYLFAAAAIGILLATIARSMAQFGLLCMITIIPMMMLSGGMSPLESQPDWLQRITWFLPSRQYMSFAQSIAFRGVGFDIVWPEFVAMVGLGMAAFLGSLALFRRSVSATQ
ncbi:Inner membrane transport permease YhhJ [Rubripirellula amarantea]|uniref:Inner membrane transport permease YhhJ n=1 Tax=Rubripirellula amarantea TaxID=2527999 RepID=A0A5C5WE83_9BACT|nr:ABC transporter permease [Rubripirellula amarantea]TWT49286.1 Inner membrane transport permease YhhJ [Rubripirellula amarantea]